MAAYRRFGAGDRIRLTCRLVRPAQQVNSMTSTDTDARIALPVFREGAVLSSKVAHSAEWCRADYL